MKYRICVRNVYLVKILSEKYPSQSSFKEYKIDRTLA